VAIVEYAVCRCQNESLRAQELRAATALALLRREDLSWALEVPLLDHVTALQRGAWASEVDLLIASEVLQRPVEVWLGAKGGYRRIQVYGEDLLLAPVSLHYNGVNHYSVLLGSGWSRL